MACEENVSTDNKLAQLEGLSTCGTIIKIELTIAIAMAIAGQEKGLYALRLHEDVEVLTE